MKKNRAWILWDILYPVLLYLVISDIVMEILCMAITKTTENDMLFQIAITVLTFPFVYYFYVQDKKTGMSLRSQVDGKSDKNTALRVGLICVAVVFAGVALNNLILATGIQHASSGYERVSKSFFGSTLVYEIIGTCVLTPILEEVLYRGVVFGRIRYYFNAKTAIIASAFIFGAMHFNVVQFIYAGLIGLVLALIYESEQKIWIPILGHALTNLVSVLRVETGFLGWFTNKWMGYIPVSIVMLVIAIIIIMYIVKTTTLTNNLKTIE